jgi:two-component system chemotaxis sensor kinase CheA
MGLDLTAFLDDFRTEATEHLRTLDAQLLLLEKNPDDLAPVRAMFLAAHSLKGAGAMMDLANVEALAHAIEDVLSRLREAQQRLDGPTADALFRAFDLLGERVGRGIPGEAPVDPPIEALVARLAACDGRTPEVAVRPPMTASSSVAAEPPRALVVEDSATVRLLHATILERNGFAVDVTSDGDEGLRLALAHPYRMLVVGQELAGQNGRALLAAVRDTLGAEASYLLSRCEDDETSDDLPAGVTALPIGPPPAPQLVAAARALLAIR